MKVRIVDGQNESEPSLARRLCSEHLTALQLKQLCRARGFPVAGGAKQDLAKSAAARMLDPLGVPEAMALLEGPWLMALHLIAAADEPLPLGALAPVVAPELCRYRAVDLRSLWGKVAAALLAKGVLLVDGQGEPQPWEKSRYAQYRLRLPEKFRKLLPPYPVSVETLPQGAPGCDRSGIYRRALAVFVAHAGDEKAALGKDLVGRLASKFKLTAGHLRLGDAARRGPASLHRMLTVAWTAGLPHSVWYAGTPVSAGFVAWHILRHLPAGHGCSVGALEGALATLGITVKRDDLETFCAEGAAAGLLVPGSGKRPLYSACRGLDEHTEAQPEPGPAPSGRLVVTAAKGDPQGSLRVDLHASSVLAVLEAADVSHATVRGGELLLDPDPVRLGRAAEWIGSSLAVNVLVDASNAYAAAARLVRERRGQVVVHTGISVLRVNDVGLRALLSSRHGDWVRELGGEYMAVLSGRVDDVLAFARKEGYVARRVDGEVTG